MLKFSQANCSDQISGNSILEGYVRKQLIKHEVPAISLAVWHQDNLYRSAHGVLNLETNIDATIDTVFQIGSITKVITSCLVMQLVDEGKVCLDIPVQHYLRDFMVADAEASKNITVRQLLNHSSGVAGDFFPDDQKHQGNLIARYVDRCSLLPLVHQPGSLYSYSNSGFVIVGRLIEVIRGISWHQAVEEYIFKPLSMNFALADPKDLIRFQSAMGHIWDGHKWRVSSQPWLSLGMAPCGSTLTMTASDLILFARAHLESGQFSADHPWLSELSVRAMQNREIAIPKTSQSINRYAGLGWELRHYSSGGKLVYGHTGATNGFCSSLQICPDENAAFALLVNGVAPAALQAIQTDLFAEVFGINLEIEPTVSRPEILKPKDRLVVGRYESMDKAIAIDLDGVQLSARVEYKIDPLPLENLRLYPITDECYACETLDGIRKANWTFVLNGDSMAPPSYLFDGSRLNPRC